MSKKMFTMGFTEDIKIMLETESKQTGNSIASIVRNAILEKYSKEYDEEVKQLSERYLNE